MLEIFYFDSFKFQFLHNVTDSYVFNYLVTDFDTDFFVMISFFGVPSRARFNYRFNVDFVNLIWDDFERFNLKKYAITILPADGAPAPLFLNQTSVSDTKLLCLQYYRAACDGWRDEFNCDNCVAEFMSDMIPLCNYRMVSDCDCKVCRRQPTSLRNMFVHNLPQELSTDSIHDFRRVRVWSREGLCPRIPSTSSRISRCPSIFQI